MKSPLLDPSKFKHVKSDDTSTTLEHKDGHVLNIMHNTLSKENRKQLEAMAAASKSKKDKEKKPEDEHGKVTVKEDKPQDIGKVVVKEKDGGIIKSIEQTMGAAGDKINEFVHGPDHNKVKKLKPKFYEGDREKDFSKGVQQSGTAEGGEVQCKHCGGHIKKYADGNLVEKTDYPEEGFEPKAPKIPYPDDDVDSKEMDAVSALINKPFKEKNLSPEFYKAQKENKALEDIFKADQESIKKDAYIPPGYPRFTPEGQVQEFRDLQSRKGSLSPSEAQRLHSIESLTQPPVPQAPVAAAPQPAGSLVPQEYQAPSSEGIAQPSLMHAYQQAQESEKVKQGALTSLADEQVKIYNKQIEDRQIAQNEFQSKFDELNSERQALMQDIKDGHVNPEKYWDNHSRLFAGIGMILAGFNPTGNPNAAIEFIKGDMERNLQAQAKNLGAKENLLAANLRQFGNMKDAAEMTRIMQADYVKSKLDMAAATAQNPLAKAAAMAASSNIEAEYVPRFQALATRSTIAALANGAGAQNPGVVDQALAYLWTTDPAQAKQISDRYVPGFKGLSPIPVPEKVRQELHDRHQLDIAAQDLYNFAKKHTGSFDPATISAGKQKALTLQSKIRESTLGTVYKESEQALLDKYVSDPTSMFNKVTTLPRLKNLMEDNQRSINGTAKDYKIAPMYQTIAGSQTFDPDAVIAKAKADLQKDPNNKTALRAIELANKKKGLK